MYLVIGFLGLATYVFTAVFVYMSEKDLEHHVTGAMKKDQNADACLHAPTWLPVLPTMDRTCGSSTGSVSFEQFRKDGFDLEHQAGIQMPDPTKQDRSKGRKKPRMILFN